MKENIPIISLVSGICRNLRRIGVRVTLSEEMDTINAIKILPKATDEAFLILLRSTLIKDKLVLPSGDSFHSTSILSDILGGTYDINDINKDSVTSLSMYSSLGVPRSQEVFRCDAELRRKIKMSLRIILKRYTSSAGRRFQRDKKGNVDFRKSFRKAIGSGWIYRIVRRKKKLKGGLMIIFDVSGSMSEWKEKILSMIDSSLGIHARVFLFSIYLKTLKKLEDVDKLDMWWSGTRLSDSLSTLVKLYSSSLAKRTVFVIVSDGCDLGSIDNLEEILRSIKKKTRAFVWINPLADYQGYRPETECMKIAAKYADKIIGVEKISNPSELIDLLN
jgi:uncharacterized protein with von Willebrand factor type A (vWA) domain